MGHLITISLVLCMGIVLAANVRAAVQSRKEHKNNIFETLPKMEKSSENKKRTLLGDNLMKVTGEDDEDITKEGSGEALRDAFKKSKIKKDWKDDEDNYDYDDSYDEDDDDSDVYDDEDEDYSGDDIDYDDDDDYDDDYDEYDDEEYDDTYDKKQKKKENNGQTKPTPVVSDSEEDDLHFADDEDTKKDLNVPDDDDQKKNSQKKDGFMDEYYDEFFEEDEDDYEEEDLHPANEDIPQQTSPTERSNPSKIETPSSEDLPTYLSNLTTSHFLLMAASALISFILFTIAFIVCCYQKRRDEKKKYGHMPFVIDSSFLGKSTQKSHPSHFVNNSSTSIVKNYQRVPTSTKMFLSASTSTSCSGLENPNHLPHFMEAGNGETKKPLLP